MQKSLLFKNHYYYSIPLNKSFIFINIKSKIKNLGVTSNFSSQFGVRQMCIFVRISIKNSLSCFKKYFWAPKAIFLHASLKWWNATNLQFGSRLNAKTVIVKFHFRMRYKLTLKKSILFDVEVLLLYLPTLIYGCCDLRLQFDLVFLQIFSFLSEFFSIIRPLRFLTA